MKSFLEQLYFLLIFGEVTVAWPGIFARGSDVDTSALHTGNPILLGLNLLVVISTLYYASLHADRLLGLFLQLKWLLPLYGWMMLTPFWSVNPALSFVGASRVVIYLLSAAVLALRFSTERLLRMLSNALLGTAVLSLVWQRLMPLSPIEEGPSGWTGVFPHKNILGMTMMLAIVVMIAQGRRWGVLKIASILLCVALLFLSQSFTSVMTAAIAVLFIISQRLPARSKAMFVVGIAGMFCIAAIVSDPLGLILAAGGKSSNFTGRDAVWAFALNAILQRPLQGYGYGAFWMDVADSASQALNWMPPHAHNGLLQVALDVGFVGLVLLIALLVSAWRRTGRLRKRGASPTATWMRTFLVVLVVHNLTEADLLSVKLIWFLFVVGTIACLRAENELAQARKAEGHPASSPPLLTALV